jgi:hypothetical protein
VRYYSTADVFDVWLSPLTNIYIYNFVQPLNDWAVCVFTPIILKSKWYDIGSATTNIGTEGLSLLLQCLVWNLSDTYYFNIKLRRRAIILSWIISHRRVCCVRKQPVASSQKFHNMWLIIQNVFVPGMAVFSNSIQHEKTTHKVLNIYTPRGNT